MDYSSPFKGINFCKALLLILACGLFRPISFFMGINISVITTVLMLGLFFLVALNIRRCLAYLRHPRIILWLVILIIWPLVTMFYTDNPTIRQVAIKFNFFLVFIVSVLFFSMTTKIEVSELIKLMVITSIIGLLLGYIFPVTFFEMSLASGSSGFFSYRAFGFFMQPNIAGTSILLLFLLMQCNKEYSSIISEILILVLFLVAILITGSRLSFLIFLISVFLIYFSGLKKNPKSDLFLYWLSRIFWLMFLGLIIFLSFSLLLQSEFTNDGSLQARISQMLSLDFFKLIFDSNSMYERSYAQSVYANFISQRPILGYGLGAEAMLLESNQIRLTSHSTLLKYMLEFGLLYCLTWILLLASYIIPTKKHRKEKYLISIIFFALFLINGGLAANALAYITLGYLASLSIAKNA